MPALLATLQDLIVGGAIAAAILAACLIYAEARKERHEPETFVEIEETPSAWDSLPPKWTPPPAESHLGKTHVGERRRAA